MDKTTTIIIAIIILVVAGIGAAAYFSGGFNNAPSNQLVGEQSFEKLAQASGCPAPKEGENADNFAKCLTERGLAMYGAEWCAHCLSQKNLFGDSFKYINYIECTKEAEKCLSAGIKGYPTWTVSPAR